MKIDKVIFSTTDTFKCNWNLISKIYRTKLNIEPICLLYGSKTGMSDEYGKIIKMDTIKDIPLLIQLTWSKFDYTKNEPETTWMIGDMDLYPLNAEWFTTNIEDIPDDYYVHLDADGIVQLACTQSWCTPDPSPVNLGHPTDLPAHYHVAKGKTFKIGLDLSDSFENDIKEIINCGFGSTRAFREDDQIEQHNLWCAEENRSSVAIRHNIQTKRINFKGFSLKHGIERISGERIDRTSFDITKNDYNYDMKRLLNGEYIDIHAARPFDKTFEQTNNILKLANMI